MNKKLKLAIPFAVLALTCGVAAGAAGCNKHQHDYSGWDHDETYHWHVCECGEIEEGSQEEHVWAGGECDCGATKQDDPIVEKKYGTVTGKVKLMKYGSQVTDSAALNKIQVDMGDDTVEASVSVADGVYSFTISKVVVGKTYDLTVTCLGYDAYNTQIELETDGENVPIGGEEGITLEFKVFNTLFGWDEDLHDYSHVNDNYIVFKEHEGNKTLNVLSSESYDDVSATLRIRSGNSTNGFHTQGIVLKFEDGRHVVVRYHNDSNIQYHNQEWAGDPNGLKPADTLFGSDAGLDENDGENKFYYLNETEMAAVTETGADSGLELNVILKDGTLYTFFDGKYLTKYVLPEGYESKKVQVGFFAPDAANNAHFHYGISTEVPETMESTISVKVNQPADLVDAEEQCGVTMNPDKETYTLGEEVVLTFTAPTGYKLNELLICGEDKFGSVQSNSITIKADMLQLPIVAGFIKEEPVALNLTIQGRKLGKTAAIAKGTQVRFVGTDHTFTVGDNGAISKDSVVKGRYTVHVDGYKDKEINFTGANDTITLEYDTFKSLLTNWGTENLSQQNAETPIITHTNDCHLITTKEAYSGSVMASVYLSGSYKENDTTKYIADGCQGVMFRFVGNGLSEHGECVFIRMQVKAEENVNKIQFATYGGNWGESGYTIVDATGANWQDLIFFEGVNADADSAKYLAAYEKGELKLSVLRDGATFHVFLGYIDENDNYVETYIGSRTFNDKYKEAKCEAGFLQDSTNKASKSWKVEIKENATLPAVDITNNTDKDAHGSISITENVKVGDTVTITVDPETNYILDALTVKNGEKEITLTKVNDTDYSFVATRTEYTVTATFKKIEALASVTFNVDEKWGANGLRYTLSRDDYDSYSGTIAENKFTATNVQMGEWTLSTTLYGAPVSFTVNVTSESATVDFGSVITNSSSAAANFKLGEGGLSYTSSKDCKEFGIKTNITGDAWISGKVKLSTEEANKLLTQDTQAPFAMYVKYSDGTTRYICLNLSRQNGDVHSCLTDDGGWWEDGHNWDGVCNSMLGKATKATATLELNKYGEALVGGSGLYYIINYDSAKGYLSIYYATGDNDFILAKEMSRDAKPGATITEFGISRGNGWGPHTLTYDVSEFNYSATLKDAWKTLSVATPTCEHCTVTSDTSNATSLGGTVEFTVTPEAGYKLTSFMVNGTQLVKSVSDGKVSYNVNGGISSVVAICVPNSSIIDTNSADYDLGAEVGGKKVVAYRTFTGNDNSGVKQYSNDVLTLLNLSAAIDNKDGAATDFGDTENKRWKVYADGIDNGTAPCIKGEFDMTVKLVKGVEQIRLFVGGWWMDNHGGTFTLKTKTGDTEYGKVTYCSPKDQTNDIIVFDVDTTGFDEKDIVECVLHFNGSGYNQLPFAGVQVLGDISGFKKESSCSSTVSIYESDGTTLANIEGDVTLTMTRESDSKVYTTTLTKNANGTYGLSGSFEAGHYALTLSVEGYECTSAGSDGIGTGDGAATTKLWIDSTGGYLWGITFKANA